jgi:hypothetical protein
MRHDRRSSGCDLYQGVPNMKHECPRRAGRSVRADCIENGPVASRAVGKRETQIRFILTKTTSSSSSRTVVTLIFAASARCEVRWPRRPSVEQLDLNWAWVTPVYKSLYYHVSENIKGFYALGRIKSDWTNRLISFHYSRNIWYTYKETLVCICNAVNETIKFERLQCWY